MKKSHIIAAALILYLMILSIGGAVYYAYSLQHAERLMKIDQETQQAIAERRQDADQATAKTEEAAASEPISEDIKTETINGVTYYKHTWPVRLPSGVYLRPFIAVGNGVCVLKNDIYYFYSIDDPDQTAWIFGDRLSIVAGGQESVLPLDPSKLRKHMASDASWLAENYVMNADEQTLAAFRRIANAGSAYIVYYKQGGKARRHDLRPQEIQRIQEMVHLYDRLNRE